MLADNDFNENLISRCSYFTEAFARFANSSSMKGSTTQEYRDVMTMMAAHYKTMYYFEVYSGEGLGDRAKTELLININKKAMHKETSEDLSAIADGVSICSGSFERLSKTSRAKINKWFGEDFYEVSTELDRQILIDSYR